MAPACGLPNADPDLLLLLSLGASLGFVWGLGLGSAAIPAPEWLGMAASSCLLLNIYDAGSLAAPHPPRVDFVLPSGIAEKHCSFSRPWQGWQLGWACMRASLLCKATSEWPMVGTKGSSLSRRFPHPCLGDFLFPACSSGALCAPLQWDQCWGGLSGGSG